VGRSLASAPGGNWLANSGRCREHAPVSSQARSGLGSRFWRVWGASGISAIGDGVRMAALPLLAAGITRDPIAVAAVSIATGLPWALFALVAGALVDRLDRRRVMGIADLCRFAVMSALALAVATHHATIAVLCVAGFALGTAETMFDNASQAILPHVVERRQLESANSRLGSVQIVAESFVGPPLGALLFVAVAALPFLVDSVSFLAAAILVLTLTGSYRVPRQGPPRHLHTEIAEGLSWLWHNRLLRGLAFMLATWNLVSSANQAILVLFALHTLNLSKTGFGLLLTTAAAGGILGSLVATRTIRRFGPGHTLAGVVLIGAASYLGIAVSHNVWVVAALVGVEGFVSLVWNVTTVSARQIIIPTALFGRVNSVYRFLSWGVIPLGAALGGVLAAVFGLRAPFLVASGTLVVMLAIGSRAVNQRTFAEAYASAPAPPDDATADDDIAADDTRRPDDQLDTTSP
jgi:MFS family permease